MTFNFLLFLLKSNKVDRGMYTQTGVQASTQDQFLFDIGYQYMLCYSFQPVQRAVVSVFKTIIGLPVGFCSWVASTNFNVNESAQVNLCTGDMSCHGNIEFCESDTH